MRILKSLLVVGVLALVAAGCSSNSNQETIEKPAELSTNKGPNTCEIVTQDLIKQKLGLTVKAPMPQDSNLGGSTCNFMIDVSVAGGQASYEAPAVIVQLSPDGAMYYSETIFPEATILSDIGDKAFIDGPRTGKSYTASALKGKNYAMITIAAYDQTQPTTDQVKDFLKAVIDQQ